MDAVHLFEDPLQNAVTPTRWENGTRGPIRKRGGHRLQGLDRLLDTVIDGLTPHSFEEIDSEVHLCLCLSQQRLEAQNTVAGHSKHWTIAARLYRSH